MGDLAAVLLDQLTGTHERVAAIFGGDIGPFFESGLSRLDCLQHVFLIALWRGVDHGAGRRVADFVGVFADGVNQLSAN